MKVLVRGGGGAQRALVIAGIVILVAGIVGLAFYVSYLRGRVDEIGAQNVELKETYDAAVLEQGGLQYQLQTCASMYQEAAAQLQAALPIGQVGWCVGMSTDLVDANKLPLVTAAVAYIGNLPPADPQANICAFLIGANVSEMKREIYIPVQRVLPGGGTESYIVYFSVGEDGEMIPLGHYDVIEQTWTAAAAVP
jgi:hypothetical protein